MDRSTMILRVVPALDDDAVATVQTLFREYAESLGTDLEFQGFAEELASLPGKYAPPRGRLLLATLDGEPAGCVALRPWGQDVCEMKRLYVRPGFRAHGLGRILADHIIDEARSAGYRRMRLDTLPSMAAARKLYDVLGFRPIAPYYANPVPGTAFLELDLSSFHGGQGSAESGSKQPSKG
jgi:ribosomal protein S18 acetylase RimI-like enzyme